MASISRRDQVLQHLNCWLWRVIGTPQAKVVLSIIDTWAGGWHTRYIGREIEGSPDQPTSRAVPFGSSDSIPNHSGLLCLVCTQSAEANFLQQDQFARVYLECVNTLLQALWCGPVMKANHVNSAFRGLWCFIPTCGNQMVGGALSDLCTHPRY